VFSIDWEGMMNICPTKARSNDETTTAPMTTIISSRTNPQVRRPIVFGWFLLRLAVWWTSVGAGGLL
jgi:hypothetical protein